jgi:hypothetical protein
MVLLKGVWFRTMYKLYGSTISDGCNINSFIVPHIGSEEEKMPTLSREKTMLWHQILGNIGEKGLRVLHGKGMVEGVITYSFQILWGLYFLPVSVILLVFSPSVDSIVIFLPIPACLSLSFAVILVD